MKIPGQLIIHRAFRSILLMALSTFAITVRAQQQTAFTLEEVKAMALQHNKLLSISRNRVVESEDSVIMVRSKYFPNLKANAGYAYTDKTDVTIKQGKLGTVAQIPIPPENYTLFTGNHNWFAGSLGVQQPLTQLTKISAGVQAARLSSAIARAKQFQSESQVRQAAEKLYYGLLISRKQQDQAQVMLRLLELQRYDAESAVMAGKADSAVLYGLDAKLAGQQQKLLEVQDQWAGYREDLNILMGRTPELPIEPIAVKIEQAPLLPLESYLTQAATANADVRLADLTYQKTAVGISAAKKEYLPNISAFAGYTRQDIVDFLPQNNFSAGLILNWTILDFGTRKALLHQRNIQRQEAADNLEYTRQHISAEIEKKYRKVKLARLQQEAAARAVQYRRRALQLKQDAFRSGKALKQDVLSAESDLSQAEVDAYSADLNYLIVLSDLKEVTGTTNQIDR